MLTTKEIHNSRLSSVHHLNSFVDNNNKCSIENLNHELLSACSTGDMILIQGLIVAGADVNCKDTVGNTPLLTCTQQNNLDLARFLLHKNANANIANSEGNTALIIATLHFGSCELIKLLLSKPNRNIEHKNNKGFTALMTAIDRNYLDAVYLLLDFNATYDVQKICSLNDDTLCAESIADKKGLRKVINLLKAHREPLSLFRTILFDLDVESTSFFLNYHFIYCNYDKPLVGTLLEMFLTHLLDKEVEVGSSAVKIIKLLLTYYNMDDIYLSTKLICVELSVMLNNVVIVELFCRLGKFIVSHKALTLAASSGNVDMLKVLLSFNCETNKRKYNEHFFQNSALHQALLNRHYECARLLLKHGVYLELGTILTEAIKESNESIVQFLANETPLELHNILKNSDHLNIAVQKNNVKIIQILLNNGADVNAITQSRTPLINAIKQCRAPYKNAIKQDKTHLKNSILSLMIAFNKCRTPLVNANKQSRTNLTNSFTQGRKPMKNAADFNVIDLLLEHGADVNLVVNQKTSLHHILNFKLAYRQEYKLKKSTENQAYSVLIWIRDELVQRFLHHGASVVDKDNNWTEPLITAAVRWPYSLSVLQLLVEAGADVKEADQRSPVLYHAVTSRDLDNVKFVMDHGAGFNAPDSQGQLPIFSACSVDILRFLIEHGADVNIKNWKGNTPLQEILLNNNCCEELFHILIKAGCDANHCNNLGESAILLAARKKNASLVDLLVGSGADINVVTKSGETILTILLGKIPNKKQSASAALRALLGHEPCLLNIPPSIVHLLITSGLLSLIPKTIALGTMPTMIEVKPEYFNYKFSPLKLAIWLGTDELVQYFIDIKYITQSDCSFLCGNRENSSGSRVIANYRTFIESRPRHPLTLETLSFVAVSSVLGFGAERKHRVKQTRLPKILQDSLLFKKEPPLIKDNKREYFEIYHEIFCQVTSQMSLYSM